MSELLKFTHGNAKISDEVWIFSLPSGWTCPGAKLCLAKADRDDGTLTDGKGAEFRCHEASAEARWKTVRDFRWRNFKLLQGLTQREMTDLLLRSLTDLAGIVRVNVAGDFFSMDYFDAWLKVATVRTWTRFYFYTKSLHFWRRRIAAIGDGYVPGFLPNVIPTASWGGRYDNHIRKYHFRSARVVFSQVEADRLGLEIDHDDRHAMRCGPDFALFVHGTQPPGSDANKAREALKKETGWTGYSRTPLETID